MTINYKLHNSLLYFKYMQHKYCSFLIMVMIISVYPPHRVAQLFSGVNTVHSFLSIRPLRSLYSSFLYSISCPPLHIVGRGGERQTHSCQSLAVGNEESEWKKMEEQRETYKNEGGMEEFACTKPKKGLLRPQRFCDSYYYDVKGKCLDVILMCACMVQFCLPRSNASHIFILFLFFQHIVFG